MEVEAMTARDYVFRGVVNAGFAERPGKHPYHPNNRQRHGLGLR
jgi:hypothetical protein